MKLQEILENIRALDLVGDAIVTVERSDLVKLANKIQDLAIENEKLNRALIKANREHTALVKLSFIDTTIQPLRDYAIKAYKAQGK